MKDKQGRKCIRLYVSIDMKCEPKVNIQVNWIHNNKVLDSIPGDVHVHQRTRVDKNYMTRMDTGSQERKVLLPL